MKTEREFYGIVASISQDQDLASDFVVRVKDASAGVNRCRISKSVFRFDHLEDVRDFQIGDRLTVIVRKG